MPTATDRARVAAKSGYALSELVNLPGFFYVHKPDQSKYLVDGRALTCDCPASVTCKHVGLLQISLRYLATMERKARKPRRHFSRRHIQALRAMTSAPAPPPTTEERRKRIAENMKTDFPD